MTVMFEDAFRWTDLASVLLSEAGTWLHSVYSAAASEPAVGALLLFLAMLAGLVCRRFSLLLAAVFLATFGTSLVAAHAPEMRSLLIMTTVGAQILLLSGAWTIRRQIRRLSREACALEAEKHKLKALLDREILWRTAAGE